MYLRENISAVAAMYRINHIRSVADNMKCLLTLTSRKNYDQKGCLYHTSEVKVARDRNEKIYKKNLQKRLADGRTTIKEQHFYKNMYPWKSKHQLADYLCSSEIFNKDDLIVLDKPYGIPVSKQEDNKDNIITTVNSGGLCEHNLNLQDTLPLLCKHYNTDHLDIVKTPGRWTSGMMLLSKSKKMSDHVKKCRRITVIDDTNLTFHVITLGRPSPQETDVTFGLTLKHVENIGSVPIVVDKYSKSQVRENKVKVFHVKHKVHTYNEELDVALVEINIRHNKWNALRVWMSYCYSPILGDHVYCHRIKSLLGQKVKVNLPSSCAHQPPNIPASVLEALHLRNGMEELIPCHIHQSIVQLPAFKVKKKKIMLINQDNDEEKTNMKVIKEKHDLYLNCPIPEYFAWTCEALGLDFTDSILDVENERDEIDEYDGLEPEDVELSHEDKDKELEFENEMALKITTETIDKPVKEINV